MGRALRNLQQNAAPYRPMAVRLNPAYKTIAPPRPKLTPDAVYFRRALNAAQLAHSAGEVVSYNAIVARDAELAHPLLHELLETELFREALDARGISNVDFLTEEQVAAITILADHTVRKPERAKLRAIGVSWPTFQNWLAQPAFRREYRAMQQRVLHLAAERGDTKLAELIDDGNLKAIEYANAYTGRYDPAQREAVNTMMILQMVQSLVQKHVTDEVTLLALSEDMARLAQQGGLRQLETLEAEVVEPLPE